MQGWETSTVGCRVPLFVLLCISASGIQFDHMRGGLRQGGVKGTSLEFAMSRKGDLRNRGFHQSERALEGSAHGLSLMRDSRWQLRLRGGAPSQPEKIDWAGMGSEDIAAMLQELQLNEKDATQNRFVDLLCACSLMVEKGDLSGVQRSIQVLEMASQSGVKFGSSENGAYEASRKILDVAQREGLLKECANLLALMEDVELEMPLSSHHSVVEAVRSRLANGPRFSSNDLKNLSKMDGMFTEASMMNFTEPVIELPEHPKLVYFTFGCFTMLPSCGKLLFQPLTDSLQVRGTLTNGFRYAILPNRQPPNRMCATLQVQTHCSRPHDPTSRSRRETERERGLAGARRVAGRGGRGAGDRALPGAHALRRHPALPFARYLSLRSPLTQLYGTLNNNWVKSDVGR
eukprot:3223485-Rhodomonas_salina.3